MKYQYSDYQESADALKSDLDGFRPKALLVLGGGLECLLDTIKDPFSIPFSQIPHMKDCGESDEFVFGTLDGSPIAAVRGYPLSSGCALEEMVYPVRVAWLMGIQTLLQFNSAGAVNPDFRPGDMMLVTDHIAFSMESPLAGENLSGFGPRHPDVSRMYSEHLLELAHKVALESDLLVQDGVLLCSPGPQFETPAECRAAHILGADAIGMSTAPQALVASHCSMDLLTMMLLTNMGAGLSEQPLFHSDVVAACLASQSKISQYIGGILSQL